MNEFFLVFYVGGILHVEIVRGYDVIGVTRIITKKYNINTSAIVSVTVVDKRRHV
jgi:hypothetical protein